MLLHKLSDGLTGASPLLAADFQPFSAKPRLSRLLGTPDAPHPVYEVDLLSVLPHYIALPELAATCAQALAQVTGSAEKVVLVSHCSTAALVLGMAKVLAPSREVATVLAHPTWVGDAQIRTQFAGFREALGAFRGALGAQPQPETDLSGDPVACLSRLEAVLGEDLAALAVSRGLDAEDEAFTDLLGTYRSWLAFLLASREAIPLTWDPATASVTVLAEGEATVPGLGRGEFREVTGVTDAVTPDLARLVLQHL